MTNLYITATNSQSGKSAIALGLMELLRGKLERVGFFRPIISQLDEYWKDHDIELIRSYYKLDFSYEECYACTLSEARALLNSGQMDVLIEKILRKYAQLKEKCDFILCEGTDFLGKEVAFEFDLNLEIAANIGSSMLIVANAQHSSPEELASNFHAHCELANVKGIEIVSCIFNMSTLDPNETKELYKLVHKDGQARAQIYSIPSNETLRRPTIKDVARWINARILHGHERTDIAVSDYLIAAMQVNNFLDYIEEGNLVITPSDRSDIILGSLSSRLSNEYPNISGILLTGGLEMASSIQKVIEGWTNLPIPILAIEEHTYKAVSTLTGLYGIIEVNDERKINTALALFEQNIDREKLSSSIVSHKSEKQTPMMFEFQIMEQARKQKMRIVLPESLDERILRAVDILLQRNVADIILLGDKDEIHARADEFAVNISKATIIDPEKSEYFDNFVTTYHSLREQKGVNLEIARDRMLDSTYFGTMMVHKGLVDGMVSGAVNTTAHTIRPALEFIKTKPSFSIVSSVFFMCLKDRVLAFGDCAINPTPNAKQLAEIAINTAETAKIFGLDPRVAMLSYSTGSSGKGADVEKVIEATNIVRESSPKLLVEGPIQYDAAIDPHVARTKLPDSLVAGRATVFIFPDLNTGNNTYKAVQRAADAVAIGPILQGLNKPVNDLSRGCTVADIVNTVAITAIQAQAEANS